MLAHPVTEAGVTTVSIYLPGGASEYWYDIETYKAYPGTGNLNMPVTLDKVCSSLIINLKRNVI